MLQGGTLISARSGICLRAQLAGGAGGQQHRQAACCACKAAGSPVSFGR